MKGQVIKKVLIANRGEIALRIISTCHAEGLLATSIYTKEDELSLHVYKADEAYPLTKEGYIGYMDQEEIISIAKECHADAIHPGYGFLSEDAEFAKKVVDSGITWIGPDPQDIQLMGSKTAARDTMEKIGVPIIPGISLDNASNEFYNMAKQFADEIEYPVILKAALGGGGKAMQIIHNKEEFRGKWERVCLENKTFFKSEILLLEKYIRNGRHIEIQIASDGETAIHLYERECSIQRRQQKVIEEAPCRFVSRQILQKMYSISTSAVKKLGYKNLGTIEFIVTPQEQFYFLEMNTRLQVEHTVTEAITGVDLVWLQLEIAQGKTLPLTQSDVSQRGHAIECRILTEDPANNYSPSCGTLKNVELPNGPYVRHEHAIEEGQEVSPFFDSMISKLVTHSRDRNAATVHMINALKNFHLSGIKTNILMLRKILDSEEFIKGQFHTKWLESFSMPESIHNNDEISGEELAIISHFLTKEEKENSEKKSSSLWKGAQWR